MANFRRNRDCADGLVAAGGAARSAPAGGARGAQMGQTRTLWRSVFFDTRREQIGDRQVQFGNELLSEVVPLREDVFQR